MSLVILNFTSVCSVNVSHATDTVDVAFKYVQSGTVFAVNLIYSHKSTSKYQLKIPKK